MRNRHFWRQASQSPLPRIVPERPEESSEAIEPAPLVRQPGSGCFPLDVHIDHDSFELIWLAQERLGEMGLRNDVGSVIDRALVALIESFEERRA